MTQKSDATSVSMDQLITHRFRGFSAFENTLAGLSAALDFGCKLLEFDIRAARCGTPMIYHDPNAKDGKGRRRQLCEIMANDFAQLGGAFAHMPTAEALFALAASHPNQDVTLLVDIKDAGFEEAIMALMHMHGLQSRVIYVSWVPEVLYAIHELDPNAKLCLSHWCRRPGPLIRAKHKVNSAKDGLVPNSGRREIIGQASGWFVNGPLRGKMRDMVDYVCVPQDMVTADLVADYHRVGIKVSTFSYTDWAHINDHKSRMNIDWYFINNKTVFDEFTAPPA